MNREPEEILKDLLLAGSDQHLRRFTDENGMLRSFIGDESFAISDMDPTEDDDAREDQYLNEMNLTDQEEMKAQRLRQEQINK